VDKDYLGGGKKPCHWGRLGMEGARACLLLIDWGERRPWIEAMGVLPPYRDGQTKNGGCKGGTTDLTLDQQPHEGTILNTTASVL